MEMTFNAYMAKLRALLVVATPGAVLKIGSGLGATLIQGNPVWFDLDDRIEDHSDFDESAWNDSSGSMDGQTPTETWGALASPEFVATRGAGQACDGLLRVGKSAAAQQPFTVCHITSGAITVDHRHATDADSALAQALADGLTDPVVFAGHIAAVASN
ncbi:Uncharacterised protein [Achromobacter xylosoxidans]|uniref:hypothetical protein n=1 Tax=Achromobacter TaxID=222 RepID=UPI0006C66DCE|nr:MULTISPECIES: hypothetical protein [Achromobacter]CAB3920494.1 hypothetical protein LMG26846_05561 [Achromobacter insuavis]CUJ32650.1 Uncharacterised protein [Achromobacter xylosoxidans]CUJ40510.1 Uncharacterised protein [Achromobacter sp. 2789STDY5608621]